MAEQLPPSEEHDESIISCQVLVDLVAEAVVRSAVDDLDRPHVAIIRDPRTGSEVVTGPYLDAFVAMFAIEGDRARDVVEGMGHCTYSITPLLAPE